jgi:hypothetical protein
LIRLGGIRTRAVVAALTLAGSCGEGNEKVADLPVAFLGERVITRGELDDYFASQLQIDDEGEWEPEAVTAEVRSRLLDDLVREIALAAEAESAGLDVDPGEIDAWLAGGPAGTDRSEGDEEARRRRARREILVQKLLESEARMVSVVTDEELDAFVAGAAGTGDPESVRRSAREHLERDKAERAVAALVARVMSSNLVRVVPENLPFRYVAESTEGPVH